VCGYLGHPQLWSHAKQRRWSDEQKADELQQQARHDDWSRAEAFAVGQNSDERAGEGVGNARDGK